MADAVVLWTRVTPTADATPGSGAGPAVTVGWEVAADAGFRRIVPRGTAGTGPARDHTVKVDAGGLAPATTYWYRFSYRGTTSPVGRTRTAPAPTPPVRRGCAWRSCRARTCRPAGSPPTATWPRAATSTLVVHLGDYLYEYAPGEYRRATSSSGRTTRRGRW